MKHRAKRERRPARSLLVALTAGGMIAASGVAFADAPYGLSSPEEAIEALNRAEREIDMVRDYLEGLQDDPSVPPTWTPVPTPTSSPAPTTTVSPTTTRKPSKTSEPTTTQPRPTDPPQQVGDTAAERYGWGTPAIADEFNYTGAPNPDIWRLPDGCWDGHAGNGRRCADNSTVDDGIFTMRGEANGDTGWMKMRRDGQYGRWEAKVRSRNTGESGQEYHPLLLIWPSSDERVRDGEYDWMENGAPGEDCIGAFMHYPGETPHKQEHFTFCDFSGGLDEWQHVAFEWSPDGLSGFINGHRWFHTDEADIADMPAGEMVVQLDNFHGEGMRPAVLQLDWVRFYELS